MSVHVGSICIKKRGREAGRQCVVIDIIDESFVLVTGPRTLSGVKRRRVNINHLEPTQIELKLTQGASDEDVLAAAELEGKTAKLKSTV